MVIIGICDDDIQYMNSITQIVCSAYENISTLNEKCECVLYSSGKELIDNFVKDKIDVFILDIECGEMSGFNIAKELLKRKRDIGIVYITNYPHYVYDAYVCRPLGFIRKNSIKDDIKMPMINIIEYLEERRQKIVFEDNKGSLVLNVADVAVVEAFDHKLNITLIDRELECVGPLSKYEKTLGKSGFIRISRSILVNKKFITKIKSEQIWVCDKKVYTISRRRVKEVRETWGKGEGY